jgi:branched-chain amino acid transport system ATP-binding protein
MLGIGKGLMTSPRLLLIDEPSSGLAPKIVLNVFEIIKEIQIRNVTIVLVEQNIHHSLELASRAYVIENGTIVMEGASMELMENEHIRTAYLGI